MDVLGNALTNIAPMISLTDQSLIRRYRHGRLAQLSGRLDLEAGRLNVRDIASQTTFVDSC
jgi:hypothetical protein